MAENQEYHPDSSTSGQFSQRQIDDLIRQFDLDVTSSEVFEEIRSMRHKAQAIKPTLCDGVVDLGYAIRQAGHENPIKSRFIVGVLVAFVFSNIGLVIQHRPGAPPSSLA